MCVCVCVCVYIHTHTHTHTHIYIYFFVFSLRCTVITYASAKEVACINLLRGYGLRT